MIQLNELEAQVVEMLREGISPTEIGKRLDKTVGYIRVIISWMLKRQVLERLTRNNGKVPTTYRVLVDAYEITNRRPNTAIPVKWRSRLTDEQRLYLVNHYAHQARRELAKRLGLPKVLLNIEIEVLRELGQLKGETA